MLARPSKQTDAWIVAALDPRYTPADGIECEHPIDRELWRRGHLRMRDGEVKKSRRALAPLLQRLVADLPRVCAICSQAERFRAEFAAACEE